MLIRVEQVKGRKERYVTVSPDLLDLLPRWWLVKRPRGWLFPGPQPAHRSPRSSSIAPATLGHRKLETTAVYGRAPFL